MSGGDDRGEQGGSERKGERRKRSPFDYLNQAGTGGSVAIGIVILNMLMQQSETLQDHTQWIHRNTESATTIEQVLREIHKEFENDIDRFELKHAELSQMLRTLALQQEGMAVRLQGVEALAVNPQARPDAWTATQDRQTMAEYDDRIKIWAGVRFRLKNSEAKE